MSTAVAAAAHARRAAPAQSAGRAAAPAHPAAEEALAQSATSPAASRRSAESHLPTAAVAYPAAAVAGRKRALRAAFLARWVSRRAARGAALAAARRLGASPAFSACTDILLYADLPGELPARPFYELARRAGKRLLWPRVTQGTLAFAHCAGIEALAADGCGVPAPPPDCPAETPGPDALLLIPGLAFDRAGYRLGRGGGHYDRALAQLRAARPGGAPLAVGVGYALRILDELPRASHDARLDLLLSENGLEAAGA